MTLIAVFRSIELILNNNYKPMVRSLTWQKFRPLGPIAKGHSESPFADANDFIGCSHKMWIKMSRLLTNTATKQRQKGKLECVVRLKYQLIG